MFKFPFRPEPLRCAAGASFRLTEPFPTTPALSAPLSKALQTLHGKRRKSIIEIRSAKIESRKSKLQIGNRRLFASCF
jgi:hypothetical protein